MAQDWTSVEGRKLATLVRERTQAGAAKPGVVWLGGFRSDMTATKASALDAWAEREGRAFLRFDYTGHGASTGDFAACTLSTWLADSLGVIEQRTSGPQILVGSSMGGWIALLVARILMQRDPARLAGLVLIAPAPDFTQELMWDGFSDTIRSEITGKGVWMRPSAYSPEPTPITRALIEDGRKHLLLGGPVDLPLPVHILHGTADPDVPVEISLRLMSRLTSSRVTLSLVKDGDHRLSNPADLDLLVRAVEGICT